MGGEKIFCVNFLFYINYMRIFASKFQVFHVESLIDSKKLNKKIKTKDMLKKTILMLAAGSVLCSCGRKSLEEQMEIEAREFTLKQCPKVLDDFTTLDSITFKGESHTSCYYYTIQGELDNPDSFLPSTQAYYRETMMQKVRDDLNLRKAKDAGISFAYHFLSKKTGKELLGFIITKEDYTGKIRIRSFNERETSTLRDFTRLKCPMKIDEYTMMDSMWYDSISRTIYYDYTVTGMLDDDSIYQNKETQKLMKRTTKQNIKDNTEITEERDKEKLDFRFRYFSATRKKKILVDLIIKNEELNK